MVFDKPNNSIKVCYGSGPKLDTVICWKCKGSGIILDEKYLPTPIRFKPVKELIYEGDCPICKGKRYIKINSDILEVYYE